MDSCEKNQLDRFETKTGVNKFEGYLPRWYLERTVRVKVFLAGQLDAEISRKIRKFPLSSLIFWLFILISFYLSLSCLFLCPLTLPPNFGQTFVPVRYIIWYLLVVAFYLYSSASDSKLGRSYANEL
jgi:hypothetical protein